MAAENRSVFRESEQWFLQWVETWFPGNVVLIGLFCVSTLGGLCCIKFLSVLSHGFVFHFRCFVFGIFPLVLKTGLLFFGLI